MTSDDIISCALKLSYSEETLINSVSWNGDSVVKNTALQKSKSAYTDLVNAVNLVQNAAIDDTSPDVTALYSNFKDLYLKLLYYGLSQSKSADVRSSFYQKTTDFFNPKWLTIYNEIVALSGTDRDTKVSELVAGVKTLADGLNTLAGTLGVSVMNAVNKARKATQIPGPDDIELHEFDSELDAWIVPLEDDVPELKNFFSIGSQFASKVLLLVSVAIAVWQTIDENSNYVQTATNNLVQIVAGYGASLATEEYINPAVEEALSAAAEDAVAEGVEIAIEGGVEAAVVTAEGAASVAIGAATFGIGLVIGIAVSAVIDGLMELFWALADSNPLPPNMGVALTVPMTTGMHAPIFANMNAQMFG